MSIDSRDFQRQLRGLFATLRTLVRRTCEGHHSVEEYASHLEARVAALARIQETLLRAPEEGVDLYELAYGELMSQAVAENRFRLHGPEVRIVADAATSLALTFYELTSNAITHGAFSTDSGRLVVSWSIQAERETPRLFLDWREFGVSLSEDTLRRKGFGRELLERMLPAELDARTLVSAMPDGMCVQVQIPSGTRSAVWRPGVDATAPDGTIQ